MPGPPVAGLHQTARRLGAVPPARADHRRHVDHPRQDLFTDPVALQVRMSSGCRCLRPASAVPSASATHRRIGLDAASRFMRTPLRYWLSC